MGNLFYKFINKRSVKSTHQVQVYLSYLIHLTEHDFICKELRKAVNCKTVSGPIKVHIFFCIIFDLGRSFAKCE